MKPIDLNSLRIDCDGTTKALSDFSVDVINPSFDNVEILYHNIEERLVNLINEYKDGVIFGCIAWLTSRPILEAMAKCNSVQIIVQKEDFLRPDLNAGNNWKTELQNFYSKLHFNSNRYECREPICDLSICGDPSVQPVRCIGNHNEDKIPAFPRAHHKFLVFCRFDKDKKYVPTVAWTGSFNLTFNATKSFENVIILTDNSGNNKIINSFLQEHHQLFTLSEPLNWRDTWSTPEFRIGT
jgi:HKD family nuclease